jgi:hypothetical protein
MSDFASYCLFVRDQKNSKKAGWVEDIISFAKENPATAGAIGGGGLGALSGIGSGNMIRNGLIGAGLGAGAGGLYNLRGEYQRAKGDINSDLWNMDFHGTAGPLHAPKPDGVTPITKAEHANTLAKEMQPPPKQMPGSLEGLRPKPTAADVFERLALEQELKAQPH